MILGIETSCDETAAAVITPDGQVLSSIVASQAELHAHYGGVVPEVASRRHLELIAPVSEGCPRRGGRRARRAHADRRHARAGADRCAARRALGGQGDRVVARDPARAGRPPPGSRRVALPRGSHPSSRPSSASSRAGGTRCSWPCASAARSSGSARRSTTPRARRSTRARACSACRTRAGPRSTRSPASGDPEAFRFPIARVPGLDFSFSGVKTSLLYAVRDLGEAGPRRSPGRSRRLLPARDRPRPHAAAARGGGAHRDRAHRGRRRRRGELRAPGGAAGCGARAARALHRQRGDDRVGGALRRPLACRRGPNRGCVCVGCLAPGRVSPAGVAARRRGVGVAVLAIAALLLVAGASGADEPEGSAAGLGEPARRSALGAARWALDRRPREAVTRHACRGRRRRRHRGAGARLDGRGARSAARGARSGSRSRGRRSSPSTRTTGCSTASRRRSMPARSRSWFAIPT